jgi:peptide/nickel transport system permease protein
MPLRRLLFFPVSLVFVVTVSFLVVRLIPGSDGSDVAMNEAAAGLRTAEVRLQEEEMRRAEENELPDFYISRTEGLSRDNRFHRWLFGDGNGNRGILHGDLGRSVRTGQPVSEMISDQLPWTFGLSGVALLLSILISVPVGLYCALQKGGATDRVVNTFSLVIFSMPAFWIAALLQLLFADPDLLGWFHGSGSGPSRTEHPGFPERIPYLILPLSCYVLFASALLTKAVRDAAAEEYRLDYILSARSKGLTELRISHIHVLRKLLPVLITALGNTVPAMVSGSILIESVFALPGMGLLIEAAIHGRDYPLLSGVFLICSLLILIVQLAVDVAVRLTDPRTGNPSEK